MISVKFFKHGQIGFGPSMIKSLFGPEKRRQLEDKVKRRGLTLLDMNKNVLVTPKEVCLLSVHWIRQDGIDGIEPGSFERRPLSNDVLRSINDTVIRGTCQREYGQCHKVDRQSRTRISINECIILKGEKIHMFAFAWSR